MRITFLTLASILFITSVAAQSINFNSTIKVDPNDSEQVIIEKAAHVIPTPVQLSALRNEFIAFIHFGPNTFTRKEWGDGKEDPKIFDLKNLDTDQWCESMKSAGMKMVIITVKHHDGFVLWQSRYTKHGIMSTNFQKGEGDILKELSKSCQKYGLKLGVYLSPADLFQMEDPSGLYGNLSKYTKRTIPRPVEGRPFENKKSFEFVVDDYNEYFLNQLFEILTEYGPIEEVWFDGAHPKTKGGQTYNYSAWKELIKAVAPKAIVFGKEDIRWCGNESGNTRSTEWNVIPYPADPNTMDHFPDLSRDDLGSRNMILNAKYLHYQQAETNTSIREGWFYRDDTHQRVRSTDDVFDIYERSVGGNSTFLLNIPPNREGRFSETDVRVLNETGKIIRETYGVDLLSGAKGSSLLFDKNDETFVEVQNGTEGITVEVNSPITINRIVLQEAISKRGERVERHAVDAWINGQWTEIANATNIGYKRILRFPDVTTTKIRLRILESRLTPSISTISAHFYRSRPPQLTISRSVEGLVEIKPKPQDFAWKAHGEDVAKNLNAGYKIYYTTNGDEPTKMSTLYTSPFKMANGEVKAAAFVNNELGAVTSEKLGFIKKDWKLLSVSSEMERHKALAAFDENTSSYWASSPGKKHPSIAIDLGKRQKIKGFAYTPPVGVTNGLIEKGSIWISNDGKKWKKVGSFEFGNLINDPQKRFHFFKKTATSRFIRIDAEQIAANGDFATAAEVDFF